MKAAHLFLISGVLAQSFAAVMDKASQESTEIDIDIDFDIDFVEQEVLMTDDFAQVCVELIKERKPKSLTYHLREAYHLLDTDKYDWLVLELWQKTLQLEDLNWSTGVSVLEVLGDALLASTKFKEEMFLEAIINKQIWVIKFIDDTIGWKVNLDVLLQYKDRLYAEDTPKQRKFFIQLCEYLHEHGFSPIQLMPDGRGHAWYRAHLFNYSMEAAAGLTTVNLAGNAGEDADIWHLSDGDLLTIALQAYQSDFKPNRFHYAIGNAFSYSNAERIATLMLKRGLGIYRELPSNRIIQVQYAALDLERGPLLSLINLVSVNSHYPATLGPFDCNLFGQEAKDAIINYGAKVQNMLSDSWPVETQIHYLSDPNVPHSITLSHKNSKYPINCHAFLLSGRGEKEADDFRKITRSVLVDNILPILGQNGFKKNWKLCNELLNLIIKSSSIDNVLRTLMMTAISHMNPYPLEECTYRGYKISMTDLASAIKAIPANLHAGSLDFHAHVRFFKKFCQLFPEVNIQFAGHTLEEEVLQSTFDSFATKAAFSNLIIVPENKPPVDEYLIFYREILAKTVISSDEFKTALQNPIFADTELVQAFKKMPASEYLSLEFIAMAALFGHAHLLRYLLDHFGTGREEIDAAWKGIFDQHQPRNPLNYHRCIRFLLKFEDKHALLMKSIEAANFKVFYFLFAEQVLAVKDISGDEWVKFMNMYEGDAHKKFVVKVFSFLIHSGLPFDTLKPRESRNTGRFWYFMVCERFSAHNTIEQKVSRIQERCKTDWTRRRIDMLTKAQSLGVCKEYTISDRLEMYKLLTANNPDWLNIDSPVGPLIYDLARFLGKVGEDAMPNYPLESIIKCGAMFALSDKIPVLKLPPDQLKGIIPEGLTLPIIRSFLESPNRWMTSELKDLPLKIVADNILDTMREGEEKQAERIALLKSCILGHYSFYETDWLIDAMKYVTPEQIYDLMLTLAKWGKVSGSILESSRLIYGLVHKLPAAEQGVLAKASLREAMSSFNNSMIAFCKQISSFSVDPNESAALIRKIASECKYPLEIDELSQSHRWESYYGVKKAHFNENTPEDRFLTRILRP